MLYVGTYLHHGMSIVFLSCVDKNSGKVCQQWMTESTMLVPNSVCFTRITKISDNRYLLMLGSGDLEKQEPVETVNPWDGTTVNVNTGIMQ